MVQSTNPSHLEPLRGRRLVALCGAVGVVLQRQAPERLAQLLGGAVPLDAQAGVVAFGVGAAAKPAATSLLLLPLLPLLLLLLSLVVLALLPLVAAAGPRAAAVAPGLPLPLLLRMLGPLLPPHLPLHPAKGVPREIFERSPLVRRPALLRPLLFPLPVPLLLARIGAHEIGRPVCGRLVGGLVGWLVGPKQGAAMRVTGIGRRSPGSLLAPRVCHACCTRLLVPCQRWRTAGQNRARTVLARNGTATPATVIRFQEREGWIDRGRELKPLGLGGGSEPGVVVTSRQHPSPIPTEHAPPTKQLPHRHRPRRPRQQQRARGGGRGHHGDFRVVQVMGA